MKKKYLYIVKICDLDNIFIQFECLALKIMHYLNFTSYLSFDFNLSLDTYLI